MTAILEMRGISKSFPGVKALRNVNLAVEAGEIHAICGENGAGKSTLMKILSGVYPYGSYEGEIIYQEFSPKSTKLILDEIDELLGTELGFSADELDFIINYDIKYRMGQDAGEDDEDSA